MSAISNIVAVEQGMSMRKGEGPHFSPSAGIHIGGSAAKDTHKHASISGGIRVFLIPAIEALDQIIRSYLPVKIPGVAEAVECYLQKTTTTERINCWMGAEGSELTEWLPVIDSRRERLFTQEVIQFGRRNDWTDEQILSQLQSQGWFRLSEAQARLELYDELPTIADHLHWLQRNVYDTQYVTDYQLLDGFDDRFWPLFGHDLRSRGMKEEYAKLHYAAHWLQPSPTQMQEFLYRSDEIFAATGRAFTLTDYQRLLAEQDVSPLARQWFTATVFKVPALSYLRDMYRQYIIDDSELQAYHRRLGYTEDDATRFVAIDSLQRARMRRSQGHGWTTAALAKAYASQQIDKSRVYSEMEEMGYNASEADSLMERADSELQSQIFMRARSRILSGANTQIRKMLSVGVIDEQRATNVLTDIGFPQDKAAAIVEMETISADTTRVQKAVQRIRRAFDSGEIDSAYASSALSTLGITAGAISSYLSIWSVELTPRRKRRSANQVVSDLSNGEISLEFALARLTNLGYDNPDKILFLADARRAILQRESKAEAAGQKLAQRQAALLRQLTKEAEKQRAELVKALEREESPSFLDKLASQGLVDFNYYSDRLRLYGWDDHSINLHWESTCAKKAANCQAPSA